MLSELMSEADEDTDSSEISHGAGPPGATSLVQIKSFSQVDSQSQVEAQAQIQSMMQLSTQATA